MAFFLQGFTCERAKALKHCGRRRVQCGVCAFEICDTNASSCTGDGIAQNRCGAGDESMFVENVKGVAAASPTAIEDVPRTVPGGSPTAARRQ